MRIRKCASRLLGSAYFNAQPEARPPSQLPPPPPVPAAYGAANLGGSASTASDGPCEQNRLPWELTRELDDQEDPFENYFMPVGLVLSSVAVNQEDEEMEREDKIGKKVINKQKVAKKLKQDGKKKMVKSKAKTEEAKAKKEEEEASDGDQAKVWYCKKNDGKSWHCANIVGGPNALCDHHFAQSRSYYNPTCEKVAAAASGAASASSKLAPAKASASSKSVPAKASAKSAPASAASSTKAVSSVNALASSKLRKRRKSKGGSGMEYFYYAGWGPSRGKQRGDSSSSNHREAAADAKEERSPQEDKATPEARDEKKDDEEENDLSDIAEIAGGDEESDDDYVGSGKARAGNGKGKMAVEKVMYPKMARKRVKARSLKSLL